MVLVVIGWQTRCGYGQSPVSPAEVLTPDQAERVDAAVDRGLKWLETQQQPDGSRKPIGREGSEGPTFTTAMSILALTSNYGLLPVHQR